MGRFQMITGSVLLAVVLCILPSFFANIELRKGVQVNDWVLAQIPAHNMSVVIFAIIWGMGGLAFYRAARRPSMYVTYVWAYALTLIVRMFTISIVKLDPPAGLIQLTDPLTGIFYGHATITKDLFFSGHTTTLLLIYLTLEKKGDRILGLIAVFTVACLLLVQHVHYTMDILMAPFFVYPIYRLVKLMLGDDQLAS
ncbi:PAP2 superfamily protein [Mucilaginibacter yixingensis]|uniref:PAP2 superfamily protein n=2 Tax=Mucilaginibacter yixingensis TaxID=1295612 RepID=A0A2T5JAT8_9SPHI|nr:PAP2 superfamily protein [Mucilaginibacter yixingensis]